MSWPGCRLPEPGKEADHIGQVCLCGLSTISLAGKERIGLGEDQFVRTPLAEGAMRQRQFRSVDPIMDVTTPGLRQRPGHFLLPWVGQETRQLRAVLAVLRSVETWNRPILR